MRLRLLQSLFIGGVRGGFAYPKLPSGVRSVALPHYERQKKQVVLLSGVGGDALELIVELDPARDGLCGIVVRRSPTEPSAPRSPTTPQRSS
jgi:hypothetical protein